VNAKPLHGAIVTLRPAREADLGPFAAMLATPEVARWWPAYDRARVDAEFLAEEEGYTVHAIEVKGRLVGMIQTSEENEPEFRYATVDLFLDPSAQARGIGPDAIRTVARDLFERAGHHRLTVDPAADNDRAIRAYEKVGFRAVGRLRRYQRFPDGSWRDGLLMELLAEELRDA